MKSQDLRILTSILDDIESHIPVKLHRDKTRLLSRVQAEGLEFMTKTLPTLDDALLEGLSSGTLPVLPGWKYRKSVPEFLSPLWARVFDANGNVLDDPCSLSVLFIRQVSRMYKKQFLVCEPRYVRDAILGFANTDGEVSDDAPPDVDSLRSGFRRLFPWLYSPFLFEEDDFKHGPGAVAERYNSIEKWSFDHVPTGYYDVFPGDTTRISWSDFLSSPQREFDADARLVAVPKTAKGPRLISIEPATTQYLQQGIHSVLKRNLSRDWKTDYTVQSPNQELARLGSISGDWATIDLSEASDRVSWALVQELFKGTVLMPYLRVLRTRSVDLGNGDTISLRKFASMGSALTFPIQIMVFSAIVAEAYYLLGEPVGKQSFRVYGDDIIVRSHAAGLTMDLLEYYGLKVNTKKSFVSGEFRESCGADWFRGVNVTPVYSRKPAVSRPTQAGASSLVSLRNQLWERRLYPKTVEILDKVLDTWRISHHDCSTGCTTGTLHGEEDTHYQYHMPTQRFIFRSIKEREVRERIKAPDEAKLRFALSRIGSMDPGYDPLEYQGRPRRLRSKIGRQPEGW